MFDCTGKKQMNSPKQRMCDDYCRFTAPDYKSEYGGITEETMEQICDKCPLNDLQEG